MYPNMERWIGLLGLVFFLFLAWTLSPHRKAINKRLVLTGILLQFVLALLILGIPALHFNGPLRFLFDAANNLVLAFLNFTNAGSQFLFGNLMDTSKNGFIVALQVLPTIIFMASIMSIFYHLGLMQKVVYLIAKVMQKSMKVSGAESLSIAANIFVGQTEAPLMIRPYIQKMTSSELFSVMVGGMATVAGGVLAAYVGLLNEQLPSIAGHLLTASVMSAPAALIFAKILLPETKTPETLGGLPKEPNSIDTPASVNLIDAAARGASEGLKLSLNVGAMLLAFIALIALVNGCLAQLGSWVAFESWGASFIPESLVEAGKTELSLSLIFGWIFAPLAWLMGIPWHEAGLAGALLGEKVVLNEFVAYLHLSQWGETLSSRSTIILSYALCGFANFSSIAIQIGGIGELAPQRKSELARMGIRAIIGGSLAAFSTAAIASLLI